MFNFNHLNMLLLDKLEINKIIDYVETKSNQRYNYYDEVIYKFLNSIFEHFIFISISETNKYIRILYKRIDIYETCDEVNEKHFFCFYYNFEKNIDDMINNCPNSYEQINIDDYLQNYDIEDDDYDNNSLITSNSYSSMCCLCGESKCNKKHIDMNIEQMDEADNSVETVKTDETYEIDEIDEFNKIYKLFNGMSMS